MSNLIKHLTRRGRAALLFFSMTAFLATGVRAQQPVNFGDTISEPGIYFLAGNQSGVGHALIIESDDVVVLLSRFTLRGDQSLVGILATGRDNVHILGGRVTHFSVGIQLTDGHGCSIQGTRVDHSLGAGVLLHDMVGSSLVRLRADHNGTNGVEIGNSIGCRLLSIQAHDNDRHGILILDFIDTLTEAAGDQGDGHTVKLCWAAYNALDGIRIAESEEHELSRNQCVGNGDAGIRLFGVPPIPAAAGSDIDVPGSQDNLVRSNWCVFNRIGIAVDRPSSGNTLTNNTALANVVDFADDNPSPPCANTWYLNFFLTRDGAAEACIF